MHKRHFFIAYTFRTQTGWGNGQTYPGGIVTKRKPFTPLTPAILDYIIDEITKEVVGIQGRVILTSIQEIDAND